MNLALVQTQKPIVRLYGDRDDVVRALPIVQRIKAFINSRDPKVVEMVKQAQQAMYACKALTPNAVHQDQILTTLSIRYANPTFVGTRIMPVVVVNKPSGKFYKYSKSDRLGTPDAHVGIRSTPNEIAETRTTASFATEPYALMDFVDDRLLRMQDAPLDEMADATAAVNDVMDLLEEIRIASAATTAGNFGGNTQDLAAAPWTDPASDPIGQIQAAIDGLWDAPGANSIRAVTTPEVMTTLRNHPQFIDRFKYTQSRNVTDRDVAQVMGLDELIVARARKNTANEAQTAVYSRLWGPHFVIAKVNDNPGVRQATFGVTWRFGQKTSSQWFDPMPGITGGYYTKVGLEESHDIIASDLGYLFTNVV